jgi:hypothetical protein
MGDAPARRWIEDLDLIEATKYELLARDVLAKLHGVVVPDHYEQIAALDLRGIEPHGPAP